MPYFTSLDETERRKPGCSGLINCLLSRRDDHLSRPAELTCDRASTFETRSDQQIARNHVQTKTRIDTVKDRREQIQILERNHRRNRVSDDEDIAALCKRSGNRILADAGHINKGIRHHKNARALHANFPDHLIKCRDWGQDARQHRRTGAIFTPTNDANHGLIHACCCLRECRRHRERGGWGQRCALIDGCGQQIDGCLR